VIGTQQEFESFLASLEASPWVAVDTEADSLHAYPEKVCLIQISTPSGDRLVDPLANFDLGALFARLSRHELIMHGADYDLRLLRKHHNFVPHAIFDTMVAARLLGITQFSLSSLVQAMLQVKLEKGPQKANWAIRPLTERMEIYARNDTRYLRPLADRLAHELRAKDRLEWHRESCERLIADCSRDSIPDHDQVWRIKGSRRLSRPALAVLRELWHWREAEATRANKPPYFILSHEALVRMAELASESKPIVGLLPRVMSDRRKTAAMKAIERGMKVPPEQHPRIPRTCSRKTSEAERARYHQLQDIRDRQAATLGIDPTLIANKTTLSDLAFDWEKNAPQLMNWQRRLLET